ncbi:MAG: polysaccharide deacetylase family protein [bacterium]
MATGGLSARGSAILPLRDLLPQTASALFPGIYTQGPPEAVYLTFDDGPHPEFTPRIVELLGRYQSQGTFFLLSSALNRWYEGATLLYETSQSLGFHGDRHHPFPGMNFKKLKERLRCLWDQFPPFISQRLVGIRPPYGRVTPALYLWAKGNNIPIILWSRSFADWRGAVNLSQVRRIAQRVRGGEILLLHDGGRGALQTLKILPLILETLKERGWSLRGLPPYRLLWSR